MNSPPPAEPPRTPSPAPPSAERSLHVAFLLTVAGGFLDAFTYVGHGQVFANAMTGNIVLMAAFACSNQWRRAAHHIPPIGAFLLGVFLAQAMGHPALRRRRYRQPLICLFMEIVFLALVSILPPSFPDMVLVPGIALVAAMQNSSFTHLQEWSYNSVMTTGNLRRFAETFYSGTVICRDPRALREARAFGVVCLCFLAGAAIGSLATPRLHNAALWLPIAALCAALYFCWDRPDPEATR